MTIPSARNPLICTAMLLLSFMLAGRALGAEQRQGIPKKIPTTITSARMDYDANGQTVIFLGNVYVKRPDFELWSEKMTVYLDKSGKSTEAASAQDSGGMEAGDIDHIVAEKDVRLKSENNNGTCDKATYYTREDKFVMEGRPVLRDNKQSTVAGTTIVHYLSTNRSQVIGGSKGGATATFYSEDRTEGGTSTPAPALPGLGGGRNSNGSGRR